MNKYIIKIYHLDGELLTAYLVRIEDKFKGMSEEQLEDYMAQKSMERLNEEFGCDYDDLLDLRFEIVDLNEDIYEVIDLTGRNENE